MLSLLTLLVALTLARDGDSARVLGLFPHTGKSHQMVFEPLLRRLAERGHHVTVVSFFPLKNPPANYTDVSLEGMSKPGVETFDLSFVENSKTTFEAFSLPPLDRIVNKLTEFTPLAYMALDVCSKIVSFPPLADALKKEYDVVLVENFNSDCMLGLAHVYEVKAPMVGLSSCAMMHWSADRIGVVDNPSYLPIVSGHYPTRMTFWQRLENTFFNYFYKAWFRYNIQLKEQEIIEKHFGRQIPDLQVLGKNITMMLVNVFHSLTGVRPLLPGVVEVGGMHLNYSRKPEHIPAAGSIEGTRRSDECRQTAVLQQTRCEAQLAMLSINSILTLLVALTLARDGDSARVLGLFPHTGKSHQMVFEPLLRRLAERGHHVTVVSFFPLKNPPANYTDVSLEGIAELGVECFDLSFYENPNLILKTLRLDKIAKQISEFTPLAPMALDVCSKLVNFVPLAETLKKDYDVVLVENFNSDCMLGLAHVYGVKAPTIALLSSSMMQWSADRIGASDNPSYVPILSGDYSSKMTFWQRLENTILINFYKVWFRYAIQLKEEEIIERHFSRKIPDLQDLGKNISMMLLNSFYTLNGVRPLLPGTVEVGGMHLDHSRKPEHIPAYMERFLNESEHGVVLFSFGSLIKTASIPKYKEDIFVRALSRLKQRVLWKYEDSGEEGTLQGNILKVRWLPQFELLQHHKVIAFIGHGGLLGMTEAISAGKPMLVVPFFGDQPFNGIRAQEIGFGRTLSYADLSEQELYEALQTVLSAEQRVSAREASMIWRDRQNDPLDTAVYWTERVMRWGPRDPLHSPARDLPFYQYMLLDVAALLLSALLVLLILLKFILTVLLRLISGGYSTKEKLH